MKFEYSCTITATRFLEVENIGELCLRASNDVGFQCLLLIHTELGTTKIVEYGPINVKEPDKNTYVQSTYRQISFNSKRLYNIIDTFLNNSKYGISQVEKISLEEAVKETVNLTEFIY